jgi:hypothetical protein
MSRKTLLPDPTSGALVSASSPLLGRAISIYFSVRSAAIVFLRLG